MRAMRSIRLRASRDQRNLIDRAAKVLDQYYIPTRYPDAFAEGAPQSYYDRQQADAALRLAEIVLNRAREELNA